MFSLFASGLNGLSVWRPARGWGRGILRVRGKQEVRWSLPLAEGEGSPEEAGEEGVVLGLCLSGACGNAASLKCTVGLNLKYTPLFFFLSFFSPFLFHQGLNGFEYFWGVMGG